jgi:predicted nucleic acid-binding protein
VASLGGLALIVIMAVSSLSVVMRAIPGLRSIPGDTEIVQIGCAVAVFAFLPICQLRRSNVFVDFFTAGLPQRARSFLDLLANLPAAPMAADAEVLRFIERRKLMGRGIGFLDAHLLAATALGAPARLWTRDRRLSMIAAELGVGFTG